MSVISVCVRTRNEENNIARFCRAYSFCDYILVADGGSEDRTIEIASTFPNVMVRNFTERVYGKNDIWRNPEGRHLLFLTNWAKEIGSDWIIMDDCDSFPTHALQSVARVVFDDADRAGLPGVRGTHIYMYGKDRWFPKLSQGVGFVWGWRADYDGMVADDKEEWGIIWKGGIPVERCLCLDFPMALLHDYTPTPEVMQRKLNFYRNCGKMSHTPAPLEMGGEPVDLLPWMYD